MSIIDEIIREAMRKGEFSNLPKEGQRLKLEEDVHTPEHLRVAHKLMKDNDVVPDWMEEGKGLDADREKLRAQLRRAASTYRAARNDVTTGHALRLEEAERVWAKAQVDLREAAQHFNRRVLTYNLKVPAGVVHKLHFDFERELSIVK